MASYNLKELMNAGASGFESAANYLDLSYSKISGIASIVEGFSESVSKLLSDKAFNLASKLSPNLPGYWGGIAESYGSTAQKFRDWASVFEQKMVNNPNNRIYGNGYEAANRFAKDWQDLADAARSEARAASAANAANAAASSAAKSWAKAWSDVAKAAGYLGAALTVMEILDTAMDATDVDEGIVDTLREAAEGVGGLAGGAWGAALLAGLGPVGVAAGSLGGGVLGGFLGGELFDGFLKEMDLLWPDPASNDTWRQSRNWRQQSPLVIDLDGDGIETTGINGHFRTVVFDHDGDGVRTGTSWLKSDDALLALDRDGNGTIDNGNELFGNNTVLANGQTAADGYAALAGLDSNNDGVISALDDLFGQLLLWRDLDQDGVSDDGELFAASELGLTQIDLQKTENTQIRPDGTRLDGTGSVTLNGQTHNYTDAWFAENPFYRQFTDTIELTENAKTLPNMKGSGMVRDLREAASINEQIITDISGLTDDMTRQDMWNALDSLIARWAGTSAMPTSFQEAKANRQGQ